jgi:hypothetical protein
LDRLATEK